MVTGFHLFRLVASWMSQVLMKENQQQQFFQKNTQSEGDE